MFLGPRRPSLTKKFAARTSVKHAFRHNLGLNAPRGYGWLTNPKRAAYNRAYYWKNKVWGQGTPILLVLVFAAIAWVVKVLIASWFIWVPLLVGGTFYYVVKRGRAMADEAEADAARRDEEALLAGEARAAELGLLKARFPAVHARLVPARALSDRNLQSVEVAMESGERFYLGRAADGTSIEVVTRKRKGGTRTAGTRAPTPPGCLMRPATAGSRVRPPPGAREIRSAIADLRRLDRLVAEGEAMPERLGHGGPPQEEGSV